MTQKQLILYIQNEFPSATQTFVSLEVDELRRRGHDVKVVSARRGSGTSNLPPEDHLVLMEVPVVQLLMSHLLLMASRPISYFRTTISVCRVGLPGLPWSIFFPEVEGFAGSARQVHLHTHFATRAALLARVMMEARGWSRSVLTHAADIHMPNPNLHAQLSGASLGTISRHNISHLESLGVPGARLVRCGVPASRLNLREGGAVGEPVQLVSVGRLVSKKGHATTIRAIAELKTRGMDVRLRIVGDGPLFGPLTDLVGELDVADRVHFLGALDHDSSLMEMHNADIFVLACEVSPDGDVDGIPVSFMEAAGMGIPVVGSAVGGVGELIDSKTGWLAPPRDYFALASVIQRCILNDDSRESRRVAAFERVCQEFSLKAQVDAELELFNSQPLVR